MPVQYHDHVYMKTNNMRGLDDPVLQQDAATKNYVDKHWNNEVFIQPNQPSDLIPQEAGAELWLDLDATGGNDGVNEVYIQKNEPSPLLQAADLWVDTETANPLFDQEVIIARDQPNVPFELWVDIGDVTPITTTAAAPADMVDHLGAIIAPLYDELARLRAEITAMKGGR